MSTRYLTALRPSPEELVPTLPDNEQVAIDLILELTLHDDCCIWDGKRYQQLRELVPDDARRGYLGTLCKQLRLLGVSIRPRADGLW
jgi:hypothetical protein